MFRKTLLAGGVFRCPSGLSCCMLMYILCILRNAILSKVFVLHQHLNINMFDHYLATKNVVECFCKSTLEVATEIVINCNTFRPISTLQSVINATIWCLIFKHSSDENIFHLKCFWESDILSQIKFHPPLYWLCFELVYSIFVSVNEWYT